MVRTKIIKVANTFGREMCSPGVIKQIQKRIEVITKKYGNSLTYHAAIKYFNNRKTELNAKKEIAKLEKELQKLRQKK